MFWKKSNDHAQEFSFNKVGVGLLIVLEDGLKEDEKDLKDLMTAAASCISNYLSSFETLPPMGKILTKEPSPLMVMAEKTYGHGLLGSKHLHFMVVKVGKPDTWNTKLNTMVKLRWIKNLESK